MCLLVRSPHESLHKEIKANPDIITNWDAHLELHPQWVQTFDSHAVVLNQPKDMRSKVQAAAIYMDSTLIPPTRKDSFFAIYVCLLATGTRHLVTLILKSTLCDCGCGGWCTLFPVFSFLHYSFASLRDNVFPSSRHDGQPWKASDLLRSGWAGMALGFVCCLLDIKGDWSEFANGWGFPTWASNFAPCMFCTITKKQMQKNVRRIVNGIVMWRSHINADYDADHPLHVQRGFFNFSDMAPAMLPNLTKRDMSQPSLSLCP